MDGKFEEISGLMSGTVGLAIAPALRVSGGSLPGETTLRRAQIGRAVVDVITRDQFKGFLLLVHGLKL